MADTEKKISELDSAAQVNSDDVTVLSQGNSQSGFASVKATILAIAQKIVTGINFTSALETESKTIAGAINEVAQGGGGSGGHTIKNDAGTSLTQRDNLQFKGVYVEDNQAGDVTKVDIVREFQSVAEIEALTGEAKKGFEVIEDNEEYIPYTGSDILFDNTDTSFEGENVQEVLEEVDGKIANLVTRTVISGSTDANGNMSLTGISTDNVLLNAVKLRRSPNTDACCGQIAMNQAGTEYFIHLESVLGGSIYSNKTDVEIQVDYI